jgi:hypothetical protein
LLARPARALRAVRIKREAGRNHSANGVR